LENKLYLLNNLKKESNEVFYSNEIITCVNGEAISYFKKQSTENDKKKIRLKTNVASSPLTGSFY